jgi:hypothetical protein
MSPTGSGSSSEAEPTPGERVADQDHRQGGQDHAGVPERRLEACHDRRDRQDGEALERWH